LRKNKLGSNAASKSTAVMIRVFSIAECLDADALRHYPEQQL
jgi:hypothetical protein